MRFSILTALLFLGIGGCRAPQLAGIPLGHWSGAGRFVSLPAGDATTQPQPEIRPYATTLDIRAGTGPATGRLLFEIVSQRGPIEGLDGDRTHLIFELEPGQVLDDGRVRTFRVSRAGVSFDSEPPTLDEDSDGIATVSSIQQNGAMALHIIYQAGQWRDLFLFRGNRLTKAGTLEGGENEHIGRNVHWIEELTRQ